EAEAGRQAGLALLEQTVQPPAAVLGGPEAGKLPHGPEPAAIHRRMDATRERRLAGESELAGGVPTFQVLQSVQSLDRQVGDGRELLLPFRLLPEGVAQRVLLPVPPGARGHRRGPASIFRFHFSPLSGSPWRSPTAGSRTCLRRSR